MIPSVVAIYQVGFDRFLNLKKSRARYDAKAMKNNLPTWQNYEPLLEESIELFWEVEMLRESAIGISHKSKLQTK